MIELEYKPRAHADTTFPHVAKSVIICFRIYAMDWRPHIFCTNFFNLRQKMGLISMLRRTNSAISVDKYTVVAKPNHIRLREFNQLT